MPEEEVIPFAEPMPEIDMAQTGFTIQIASFNGRSRAEKLVERLRKKKYGPYIVGRDLGSKGTWYRVYIGQYDSKDSAQRDLSQIKKEYKDSFIISAK